MPLPLAARSGSTPRAVMRVFLMFLLGAFILATQSWVKRVPAFNLYTLPRLFHFLLIKILGVRVVTRGAPSDRQPTLFVCNHSSYIDIPALGSIVKGSFIAKAEVSRWPIVGMMANLQNTVYIERQRSQAKEHRDGVRERLNQGNNLILFAEGTTSDGNRVLPFKSSLFSSVMEPTQHGATFIQPVSITATQLDGLNLGRDLRPLYAWYGDMTLGAHVWPLLHLGHLTVVIEFHPPVLSSDFADRKALALYCQRMVAEGVERAITGRDRLVVNAPPEQKLLARSA